MNAPTIDQREKALQAFAVAAQALEAAYEVRNTQITWAAGEVTILTERGEVTIIVS